MWILFCSIENKDIGKLFCYSKNNFIERGGLNMYSLLHFYELYWIDYFRVVASHYKKTIIPNTPINIEDMFRGTFRSDAEDNECFTPVRND